MGTSPGEGKGYSLQYSGLENSMDCVVHGVTKSWTRLSDWLFTLHPVAQTLSFAPTPFLKVVLPTLPLLRRMLTLYEPLHIPP